ncbi:V-set domain-containing T-cell activation inhibitor 1-like [Oreochromis aureus]|uniref:Ig-like domain-containing protein n=1 Tax=Oreochromis aureus TaxID=47969 RepID=A0A668U1T5_OREAU|nr:V-set domain-containing T-cell activation inhibitor 1-like [Oreochromis aureus]
MALLSLLFMSSCFLTLSGLTFGDQSGIPVIVKDGDDAILPCSLGTNENIEFVQFEWKKEGTEKKVFTYDTGMVDSPALPGRVSHFPDDLQHGSASIKINNVQLEDGGIYTCDFPTRGKTFRIELVFGTSVIVKEGDDAILPCSLGTNENIESMLFDWKKEGTDHVFVYNPRINPPSNPGDKFKDRVLHFPGELEHGNASIKIITTQLEDNGTYSCFFPKREKTFHVELTVEPVLKDRTAENIKDAVPEPIVKILDDEGLLQCEVRDISPEITVEWWDKDNKTLPSQISKEQIKNQPYIIVKTTVTKSGNYSCVATQKRLNHQILTTTFVQLKEESDSAPQGFSVWTAILIGVLVAIFVVVVILCAAYRRSKR